DYGIAGEKAVGRRFHYALLDRGYEVSGNRAAKHFVGKLKLRAAFERLHADPAIAELPMSASLLLVASLDVGPAADRLAIGNLGSVQFHFDAVAFLKTADNHLDVLLSAARQQELFRLRIAIEAQRQIFFQDFRNRIAHAVLILARLRRDGICDGRLRDVDSGISDGRSLVV